MNARAMKDKFRLTTAGRTDQLSIHYASDEDERSSINAAAGNSVGEFDRSFSNQRTL